MTTRRPARPRSTTGAGARARTPAKGHTRAGTAARSSTARSGRPSTPPAVPPRPRGKPSTKPSAARKAAAARKTPIAAESTNEPRQITVRGMVLFVVVLMAFIVLAPTLRAYVSQQEQHRDLTARIETTEHHNAVLQGEIDKWDDPAFVQARARERLGYVLPGETPYRVVDPQTVTGEDAPDEAADDGPVTVATDGPWYLTVWDSVQVAGEAGE